MGGSTVLRGSLDETGRYLFLVPTGEKTSLLNDPELIFIFRR